MKHYQVEKIEDIKADMLPKEAYCIVIDADFEASGHDVRWKLAELLVKTGAMWAKVTRLLSTLFKKHPKAHVLRLISWCAKTVKS